MKKKKGFTLVELLAVIVILAIILIIAVPQIMKTIEGTREASLESTAKLIATSAEKEYLVRQTLGDTDFISLKSIPCEDVVQIDVNQYGLCKITFNEHGKATVILNGKENGKFDNKSCSGTKDNITCQEGEILPGLNCSYEGELQQGVEFTHNQYTYRYMQEYTVDYEDMYVGWKDIEQEGWGVILTDKTSTDPVNEPVCSYINGKPLVSTSMMFFEADAEGNPIPSQATEIDVSNWDTDNVTNMLGMFSGTTASEIKGLFNLETNNVTNMSMMFAGSAATSIDLRSFDTSKVTDMSMMFNVSQVTSIDLRSFDTGKVTNMSHMLSDNQATTIIFPNKWTTGDNVDMSDMFYESSVTTITFPNEWTIGDNVDMSDMFYGSSTTTIIFPGKWTIGNNANMANLFIGNQATTIILPSKWTIGNNADMRGMFQSSAATTIKFPEEWTTGENANMSCMFLNSNATSIDLSGLDTSKVTDISYMFHSSYATTGYARTQADVDKFNDASVTGIPETLRFELKQN